MNTLGGPRSNLHRSSLPWKSSFPVLGFMSHKANVSIEQVVSSGPGLAFIVYPKAISLMPFPHFWAITFFFMIFLLGIDSQFVTCESGMDK